MTPREPQGNAPQLDVLWDANASWAQNCRRRWEARARIDPLRYTDCTHHADPARYAEVAEAEASVFTYGLDEAMLARSLVLEVGCGPGRLLPRLARRFRGAVGVDVSQTMLRLAREAWGAAPPGLLVRGGGTDLAFLPPARFYLVLMVAVALHLPLPLIEAYVREAHRVLVPGGHLRFTIYRRVPGRTGVPPLGTQDPPPGVDPLMFGADWCGHVFEDGEPERWLSAFGFASVRTVPLNETESGVDCVR
jgi:SAM-dependent methyltransferase